MGQKILHVVFGLGAILLLVNNKNAGIPCNSGTVPQRLKSDTANQSANRWTPEQEQSIFRDPA
jgi:hypothetical protein